MYDKQEASRLRRNFWTSFGQYMRPLPGAEGQPVNWLNYKTGIRHLYFRMDANQHQASIAIELRHPDALEREELFNKLTELKSIFNETTGNEWTWELYATDDDGREVSRIRSILNNVNVFNTADWPAIISFLKPGILGLDKFWNLVKENF